MHPLNRAFLSLAITVIVFYILHIGKDLILPFILAIFIWYLINVLSGAIMKLNIRGRALPASLRYVASALVIAGALGFLFNFITQNVNEVIRVAPTYQEKLLPLIEKATHLLPFEQPPSLKEFLGQIDVGKIISRAASSLASLAGSASVISIYVIFLFLEQRSFGPKISRMMKGAHKSAHIFTILSEIDHDTRAYIGIKTLVSALTGIVSYVIMASLGLDFAAFWGVLIFFLNFIPTIGSIVATLFPSLLCLLAFDNPWQIGGLIGGLTAVQVVVGNVIEPRLMGNSLNLSPLVILLSLSLWGSFWGVIGMFLCVPITVIAMIVFSHFPETRPVAVLLSSNGRIKGPRASNV